MTTLLKQIKDPKRFTKLDDGWVRDRFIGVEWGPSSDKEMTWVKAKKYCVKMGGGLPEVNELQSLIDYSNHSPTIDTAIFPDQKPSWYWSGTEVAGNSGFAWIVLFLYGYVTSGNKCGNGCVRPCRAITKER
jgi:hypothetical protein